MLKSVAVPADDPTCGWRVRGNRYVGSKRSKSVAALAERSVMVADDLYEQATLGFGK